MLTEQEAIEAAAKAAHAELKMMLKECQFVLTADNYPVSIGNYRILRAAIAAHRAHAGEAVAWLDMRREPAADWTQRVVATNPEFVEANGADNFAPLFLSPPAGMRQSLEEAIAKMGWPEIHAFQEELRKGQDIYEDAGGYFMRAIRRLFGLAEKRDVVTTYQDAATAMIDAVLQPAEEKK